MVPEGADAVEVAPTPTGQGVWLLYGARPGYSPPPAGTWLAVLMNSPDPRGVGTDDAGEPVTWDGATGRWLPHPGGVGGTLAWSQGGLRLRLDTPLSRDEATAIAASVAPAAD